MGATYCGDCDWGLGGGWTVQLKLNRTKKEKSDVTLARLASRCWARQMCPPPILSRSYAVGV